MTVAEAPVAVDVVLRDGSTVRIRPVSEDDVQAADRGFGLVATAGVPERIVGHAAYVRVATDRAEIAFEVDEDQRGLGIGTILLAHLAEAAQRDGIATFTATVHPAITAWRRCSATPGSRSTCTSGAANCTSRCPPRSTPRPSSASRTATAIAAIAAVEHVLRPASVAVIGASRRPDTVGRGAARQPPRAAAIAVRCTSCTRRPLRSAACRPTGRSPTCPAASTSPSSPCRPPRCRRSRANAARPACARWSCSPPGSPRSERTARGFRPSCWRPAAPPGCGSSAPTASACSTRRPRSGSTRRSRPRPRAAAGSPSRRRAAPSGSRRSPRRHAAVWGCPRSSPPATRPTSRATTSSASGSRTRTPTWCCSTSSRSATRAASPASPARSRRASRSSRSRAAARPPGPAPPPRTPGRCWPRRTSRSTRCSSTPA